MSAGAIQGEQDNAAAMARKPSRWLRKTKLCVYNLQKNCSLGSNCLFAHSLTELQDGPDLYKTQLCTRFMDTGKCENPDCTFAHGQQELQAFPALKQKLCKWHRKGKCRNGDSCSFAHGRQDLAPGSEQVAPAPPPHPKKAPKSPVQHPTLEQAIPPPPTPPMQVGSFATPVIAPVATAGPNSLMLADALAMPSPKVVFYSKRTNLNTQAIPYVPLAACTAVNLQAVQEQVAVVQVPVGSAFAIPPEFDKTLSQDLDSDNKSTSAETAGYLSD